MCDGFADTFKLKGSEMFPFFDKTFLYTLVPSFRGWERWLQPRLESQKRKYFLDKFIYSLNLHKNLTLIFLRKIPPFFLVWCLPIFASNFNLFSI